MGKDAPCVGPEALNPIIPFMCEFEKSQLGMFIRREWASKRRGCHYTSKSIKYKKQIEDWKKWDVTPKIYGLNVPKK